MTPGARIATAIEALEAIAAADRPADTVMDAYFRARRYMGSGDRRAVAERVFGVLRRRNRLTWHLARSGAEAPAPRLTALADLVLADGLDGGALAALFSGEGHAPAPLSEEEKTLAATLAGAALDDDAMPDWVALEYPEWLDASLRRAFGENLAAEMRALNEPAHLDLRANALKGTREAAREALAAEGIDAEPAPFAPLGLRIKKRAAVQASQAFRLGLVEVQDEGSQLVACIAGAASRMTVVDFCAGAGGKTLALAAGMGGKGGFEGTLWALDVNKGFLDRLAQRARRAGAATIRRHVLAGPDDPWIADHEGCAQRVLVDAPCSGTGTWRRHPGAKDWLTPDRLSGLVAEQRAILDAASRLVAPGGRLVYATCSVLGEENEDTAEAFLASRSDFKAVPVAEIWSDAIGGPCPVSGPYLRLSPATTGTDGFFAAVFERKT